MRASSTICTGLFTICTGLFTICAGLFTICAGLFTICASLFTICAGLFTICAGLFTMCTPSGTAYRKFATTGFQRAISLIICHIARIVPSLRRIPETPFRLCLHQRRYPKLDCDRKKLFFGFRHMALLLRYMT